MDWIAQNVKLISALTGLGTLAVWVIYLQIFISNYRRQLRATLLITRGAGDGIDARCFLSNMSSGPVYVQSVLVTLKNGDEITVHSATDMRQMAGDTPCDPRERTRQGPLRSGEMRDIGSFRSLLPHFLDNIENLPEAEVIPAITIEVLGIYGSEDLPVGARRCFTFVLKDGRIQIKGESLGTKQIRKTRERKQLIQDLERDR